MSFDDDIALTPVGDATFAGTGPDSWSVHIGLNGGYGAAVLLHAVQLAVGEPDKPPRALTVQYLRAFPAGPFTIATEVTRRGRNVTFAAARLDQAGKTVLRATAVLARGADGLDYDDTVRPRLAPPESVPTRIADPATAPPPFVQNYDTRLVSEVLRGGPRAEVHGWLRLHEPRPVDACVLAAMADALPPASFGRVEAPVAAPTIELQVLFRRPSAYASVPPGAWVQADVTTTVAAEGFLEEDCRLWAPDGRLLAQSRQLASTRA